MSVSLSLKELRVERRIKNSNSNFNFRPVNFARLEIISSKIEPLPFLFFSFFIANFEKVSFSLFLYSCKKSKGSKRVYPDDFYIYTAAN